LTSCGPRVELLRFNPGEVIVRQGEAADSFYLVRIGFVKVTQVRPGGDQVLTYIGPGGYFGEIGLLSHLPEVKGSAAPGVRTTTCSALDHVDVVRIGCRRFPTPCSSCSPQVRTHVVKVAVERLAADERNRRQVEGVPLSEFLSQGLMNAQSLLVLDLEKCTRCDECTKACSDSHDGVTRLIREGLRFDKFLVASSCRSCLDPYCMVGCPVGSIRRKESREIIIEDWCIGCGKCADNCPYGNINMHGFEQRAETTPITRAARWRSFSRRPLLAISALAWTASRAVFTHVPTTPHTACRARSCSVWCKGRVAEVRSRAVGHGIASSPVSAAAPGIAAALQRLGGNIASNSVEGGGGDGTHGKKGSL